MDTNIDREKRKIHLTREKEMNYIEGKSCAKYKLFLLPNFSYALIGHTDIFGSWGDTFCRSKVI